VNFLADFLRAAKEDVTPGFHMNKTHWNTVYQFVSDNPLLSAASLLQTAIRVTIG